jgi:hypothetical protein
MSDFLHAVVGVYVCQTTIYKRGTNSIRTLERLILKKKQHEIVVKIKRKDNLLFNLLQLEKKENDLLCFF